MHNLMKAGALALVVAGFALAPTAPANAATYVAPHLSVTVNSMHPHPRPHPRWRRVKVCSTAWHHHHPITTCTWVNKPWR